MYSKFQGAFCDLVWSDPEEVDAWAVSPRGAGWLFGSNVTNDFMHINHLKLICRAHQLVHEGESPNFPLSILWSKWQDIKIYSSVSTHIRHCHFVHEMLRYLEEKIVLVVSFI